jgi:hypothetical protein
VGQITAHLLAQRDVRALLSVEGGSDSLWALTNPSVACPTRLPFAELRVRAAMQVPPMVGPLGVSTMGGPQQFIPLNGMLWHYVSQCQHDAYI